MSALPVAASSAVILNMGSGRDCAAAGCFADSRHFSRSWSAGVLDGPTLVNSITLDRSLLGRLQDRMFTVNFYAADGSLAGTLGSFTIAGLIGEELTLRGQGFTWNPNAGDLTVRLTLADWAPPGFSAVNHSGGGGGSFVPFFRRPAAAPPEEAGDVVTETFSAPEPGPQPLVSLPQTSFADDLEIAVVSAPEPSAWALMIAGFGLAGGALRRRRALPA